MKLKNGKGKQVVQQLCQYGGNWVVRPIALGGKQLALYNARFGSQGRLPLDSDIQQIKNEIPSVVRKEQKAEVKADTFNSLKHGFIAS